MRKAENKGSTLRGIFDVAGIPGHTHNASAVASVDADYTRYRTVALNIDQNIWAYGALAFPVGLLTDSIEIDNEDERYDRAIERCVGYITLRPENCQNSIREPTRSIGEVRTLVAQSAARHPHLRRGARRLADTYRRKRRNCVASSAEQHLPGRTG